MSTDIPFVHEDVVDYGQPLTLSPLVRRVVAHNPSPFTYHGTGTFIVGRKNVAVIDPGPDLEDHVDALMRAVTGLTVSHILVTHTHRDHSPAARYLKQKTGAATYGFGPHGSGRPEAAGQVEEGADHDFTPDRRLGHGDIVEGDGWTIEAVHTPGHTSNHLCLALREEKTLFTGDHVMGWSTTIVSPPDGDMQAYMRSLKLLLARDDELYRPCHGPAIEDPKPFVEAYIAHREAREVQILACLGQGVSVIPEMVETMYADVPAFLHPAAQRSVLSHLIYLTETRRVICNGQPGLDAEYSLPA
jgi:glyoxylase-like metal-dependent hydrolase (beta-lactamase superfamily II)